MYTLVYNEAGSLISVRHISGESSSTPSWASHIDKSWALQSNWDDWNAFLEDDASPPVPVRLLFKNKKDQSASRGALQAAFAQDNHRPNCNCLL